MGSIKQRKQAKIQLGTTKIVLFTLKTLSFVSVKYVISFMKIPLVISRMGKGLELVLQAAFCTAGLLLGSLGCAFSAPVPKVKPEFTLYVAVSDRFHHKSESMALAQEFLEKEVGVRMNVVYCTPAEVPTNTLDHLTLFAFVESDKRTKDLYARADVKNSQILFYPNVVHVGPMGFSAPAEYGLEASLTSSHESVKANAFLVAHEIGHLTGLWHADLFSEDSIDDTYCTLRNVMSCESPIRGHPYGFILTESQKDKMLDYFAQGETYREMKECNFNYKEYLHKVADRQGYFWTEP